MNNIRNIIQSSIDTKLNFLKEDKSLLEIKAVSEVIVESLKNDGKVLLCGNGGSAADAQHIAAELSGKFNFDRKPLYAEALHTNTSYMTAVSNDYSYDDVYSRLLNGMGRSGDVLISLSTSGNSRNCINAINVAKEKKITTVGLLGKRGEMKELCDYVISVPSDSTPRIQEAHIMIGHIICELVENTLFGGNE